jgi:hypothetical protein
MNDKIKLIGEWYFECNGIREGPFFNAFPPEGLEDVAALIHDVPSPFLVVGDDTAAGFAITEVFRKPVSAVTRDQALVRFRTQLLTSECNGDHQKACIYTRAANTPETGRLLNMLTQPWSKTAQMILTVECKITVSEAV